MPRRGRRIAPLALLATVSLAGCPSPGGPLGKSAPIRPDAPPSELFPLAAETSWSYDVLDQQTGARSLLVNRVLRREGPRAVLFDGDDPLAYEDRGDRIVRLPSGATVLQAPLRAGATWDVPGGAARITSVDATVQAVHQSFTPCVVVEETTAETRVLTSYARDVGPVAVEVWARGPAGEQLLSRGVLRGYHRAGAPTP